MINLDDNGERSFQLHCHQTSKTVYRLLATLIVFSAFCLLIVLGTPDQNLLGGSGAILIVPFFGGSVSFQVFMFVGPAVLFMLWLFLQAFFDQWLALRQKEVQILSLANKQKKENPEENSTLLALQVSQVITPMVSLKWILRFCLYLLVPIVLIAFAWKAMGLITWGARLLIVLAVITASVAKVAIRRKYRSNMMRYPLYGLVVLGLLVSCYLSFNYRNVMVRPLDLRYSNLEKAILADSYLALADIKYSNLRGVHARKANLQFANLEGADLINADLRMALLQNSRLWYAKLHSADMWFSNLQYAEVQGAELQNANLAGADLQYANLQGVNFQNSNLSYAKLQNAQIWNSNLQGAILQGANLGDVDLKNSNLQGAQLQTASFQNAQLQQTVFRGANLSSVDFQGANIEGTNFFESIGLTQEMIEKAHGDETTVLPEGLTQPSHWMQKEVMEQESVE